EPETCALPIDEIDANGADDEPIEQQNMAEVFTAVFAGDPGIVDHRWSIVPLEQFDAPDTVIGLGMRRIFERHQVQSGQIDHRAVDQAVAPPFEPDLAVALDPHLPPPAPPVERLGFSPSSRRQPYGV